MVKQYGTVVANTGYHCLVQTPTSQKILCYTKGKKQEVVVGDQVEWKFSGSDGFITHVAKRHNLFYRQDVTRIKKIAANIDLLVFCIAAQPSFNDTHLSHTLVAAEATGIQTIIVLNKSDLRIAFATAYQNLELYRQMGYRVFPLCLKYPEQLQDNSLKALSTQLQDKTNLVFGPSGSGKSTLINYFVPDAHAQIQEISKTLNSGKHTTSISKLYWARSLGKDTAIIDTPGFQTFGLYYVSPRQLATLMPDIAKYCYGCRFHNCTHLHEPGCKVRLQIGQGIHTRRYAIYQQLYQELNIFLKTKYKYKN
jgi:ribosome biogenesis GTPase